MRERGHASTAWTRRNFLRLSAAAAGLVSACGGTSTGGSSGGGANYGGASSEKIPPVSKTDIAYASDLPFHGQLKESPLLAAQVKAGKLPPVAQRVSEQPFVVPLDWLQPGKYGGTLRTVCSDTTDFDTHGLMGESMYGHSPLRWQKDGMEIGPGLAHSWSSDKTLTTWTLHFRKGLRWSDGHPWTVDDILFWWDDEVGYPALGQIAPQELRSSKGTPVKMTKLDDFTLRLNYDSPTPLAADYMAAWTKRMEGPRWMDPKHYLTQFHLKYNPKLPAATWVDTFTTKSDYTMTPDSPTMTGWRLTQYRVGQSTTWERNPHYYAIDKWGHQLPYIDSVTWTNYQDPQTMRLSIQHGKADYVPGFHIGIGLGDVSGITQTAAQNDLDVMFWDGGDGGGYNWFFNYDYQDTTLRNIFRNPVFRQALSIAVDRSRIRKVVYYDQGQLSGGTMSPKAIEFQIGNGPSVYKQWRDAYNQYDPAKAKQMLDSIGIKVGADGHRAAPDGSVLQINLDYAANQTQDRITTTEFIAKDWQSIGINVNPNPVPALSFADLWAAGQLQCSANWLGSGDGANCLVYANWLLPMDNARWAPLEGQWYLEQGTPQADQQQSVDPWHRTPPSLAPDPGSSIEKLLQIYAKAPLEPDIMKRNQYVWQLMKIHIQDGPFFGGTVANSPSIVGKHRDLRNVPTRDDLFLHGFTAPWVVPAPATYEPETWFWSNPSAHG